MVPDGLTECVVCRQIWVC